MANRNRQRYSVGTLRGSSQRFAAATRHTGDSEHREPTPRLSDKSTLHAKSLLLPLVGVEAVVEVEPTTVVLQVMHELMDGDVILGGVGRKVSSLRLFRIQ